MLNIISIMLSNGESQYSPHGPGLYPIQYCLMGSNKAVDY